MLTEAVNCGLFSNSQLNGRGTAFSVPGICNGIQAFFEKRSLANSEIVLTWDPDSDRMKRRRGEACGDKFCTKF